MKANLERFRRLATLSSCVEGDGSEVEEDPSWQEESAPIIPHQVEWTGRPTNPMDRIEAADTEGGEEGNSRRVPVPAVLRNTEWPRTPVD